MRLLRRNYLFLLLAVAWNAAAAEQLAWDSMIKTNRAVFGDVSSRFVFSVTNVSSEDVLITGTKTSCGCTMAALPTTPWRVAPNGTGKLDVLVDVRNKHGNVFKEVYLFSTNTTLTLAIEVKIEEGPNTNVVSAEMAERMWQQEAASIDHQAVFKTTCVKCHLEPAFGKSGGPLYVAACGICHEAQHRATMVPDLHMLKTEITPDYWRNWITYGNRHSLMPGFAARLGGPLDDAQIDSLVKYLTDNFPRPIQSAVNH